MSSSLSLVFAFLLTPIRADGGNESAFAGSCQVLSDPKSRSTRTTWPISEDDEIAYVTSNFDERHRKALDKALDAYHKYTCLRFVPRTTEKFYIEIEVKPGLPVCGQAHTCFTNRPGWVGMRPNCPGAMVYAHEIGHVLCLDHEHIRPDREDYIHWPHCKEPHTIPPVSDLWTSHLGILYDYTSIMHYKCDWLQNPCESGEPKNEGVKVCERDSSNPLSPLDADRFNRMYHCGACASHRWLRVDKISNVMRTILANFANEEGDGERVHVCRGYVRGDIRPGLFDHDSDSCYIAFEGAVHVVQKHIEVLAILEGQPEYRVRYAFVPQLPSKMGRYALWRSNFPDGPSDYRGQGVVRVGRNTWTTKDFALGVSVWTRDGKNRTLVGTVSLGNRTQGEFVLSPTEVVTVSNPDQWGTDILLFRCLRFQGDPL